MARQSEGRFTLTQLEDAESGRLALDDRALAGLIEVYGVELGELIPERARLVIDLDEGRIAAATGSEDLEDTSSAEHVLVRYLGLVYALRGVPVGTPIKLRDLDVAVLAHALELRAVDVEVRLQDLMAASSPEVKRHARLFRRRLLVPMAGVMLGATAAGAIVLVAGDDGANASVTSDAPTAGAVTEDVQIGGAVVVERSVGAASTADVAGTGADTAYEVETPAGTATLIDPIVIDR